VHLSREKINSFPELRSGDVLLYGGRDLVSRLIQFRTWSDVAHVEIYAGEGRSVASRNGIGVDLYPLRSSGLKRVLRPRRALDWESGMHWFYQVQGSPYGWFDLLRFYSIKAKSDGFICSQFADLFLRHCRLYAFNWNYNAGAICPRDFEVSPSFDWLWAADGE
jgi:hypothetical protein